MKSCYYVFRAWDRCIWSLCPILYRGWDIFSALLTGLSEGNRGHSINYTLDKSLSGKCFPNSLLTSTYHEYFSVERGDAKDNYIALKRALGTQLRFRPLLLITGKRTTRALDFSQGVSHLRHI